MSEVPPKARRALVTGGAGFVGSSVVRQLLAEGTEVRVLDNLSTGYAENLEGLDVEFVEADVRDAGAVAEACRDRDVVFHLAAAVGRQRSLDFPVDDSTINLIGTVNVLEGMRAHGVGQIVYSSSAAIFGELQTPSIDESHPQDADSPYGVSKLAAEKMILSYAGIYDITGVCLRYFNIYGVRQRYDSYGNVIPIFARRILDGDALTIYGDGEQTRDFLNVVDVARANLLASRHPRTGVFNIGSGSTVTINELAATMTELAGTGTEVVHAPERPADVRHCRAEIGLAERELGFAPTVDLDEGLREYWAWFKENA